MKTKILSIILILTLCITCLCGCAMSGSKNYDEHSKLIRIKGHDDLYYYATTHVIYICFNEYSGDCGYGYMAPYYSENGKLCKYNPENKAIKEITE